MGRATSHSGVSRGELAHPDRHGTRACRLKLPRPEPPSTPAQAQVKVDTFPQPLVVLADYEHLWLRVKAGLPGTRTSSTSRQPVSTWSRTVCAAVTVSSSRAVDPKRIVPPSTRTASRSGDTDAPGPGITARTARAHGRD